LQTSTTTTTTSTLDKDGEGKEKGWLAKRRRGSTRLQPIITESQSINENQENSCNGTTLSSRNSTRSSTTNSTIGDEDCVREQIMKWAAEAAVSDPSFPVGNNRGRSLSSLADLSDYVSNNNTPLTTPLKTEFGNDADVIRKHLK
jgi:hypothetical protein